MFPEKKKPRTHIDARLYDFLICRYDLFDLFQLMGNDLIACFDADQIHLIETDEFSLDDVFLDRRHLDLHTAGDLSPLEGNAFDREKLRTAVYRLSVQRFDDVGLFALLFFHLEKVLYA